MSRMQQEKGKSGEREVVKLANAHGLVGVRTWQTAQGANPECDVQINGFKFQVKRRKRFKFLTDILKNVDGAFLRQDNGEWMVLVPARWFLELLEFSSDFKPETND